MPRIDANGIGMNVLVEGSGPPLMLLHGFTGRASGWKPFIEGCPGFTIIAVDLIGHGDSDCPPDASRYSMPACLDDLAAVLDALAVAKTALLGYSMGGRVALHFALRHADRISALILESASPGFSDPGERAVRIRSDEELADRIEMEGIEAFVDYWQALPLWQSQSSLPADKREALRAQRLRNSTTGLANSLRGMGAGAQEPVFERLGEIEAPALFLAGALDARYADLARQMAAKVPGAEARIIADAGHAAHFERPDIFALEVRTFLSKCFAASMVEA
jgi:2-succinyl-6-hydroxy-2,4-cyclohexadiene-1-carboxylate synthase